MVTLLGGRGGVHVANAEVVVQYEIMNSFASCVGIQADSYRPRNTNWQTTEQSPNWECVSLGTTLK